MRLFLALSIIAVFSAACTGDNARPAAASFTERDSAGIMIATNNSPADSLADAWTIDTVGAIRIGTVGGNIYTQFNAITSVVLTSQGEIVVGNGNPAEIRVFNATGQYLRTLGRQGEGPGEFQQPPTLFLGAADTIIASENRFGFQLNRFTTNAFVTDSKLDNAAIVAALPPGMRRGDGHADVFPSGAVVVSADTGKASTTAPEGESAPTQGLTAVWLSADRTRSKSMAKVQDMEIILVGPGKRHEVYPIEERRAIYGMSAKHPSRFCLTNNRATQIHCIDDEDGAERIIRWQQPDVPIAQAEIDRVKTRVTDATELAALLTHKTYRPIEYIHVLVDHSVLVVTADLFDRKAIQVAGRLFSPSGQLLGKVTFPRLFFPLFIENDRVAGIQVDDDRVQSVALFRIVRRR